jgi:CRISP-associated protein Cas1
MSNPPQMTGTKSCRVCGEIRPITDFYAASSHSDGRRNECRDCARRAENDHAANRRDMTVTRTCSWCSKSFHPWKKTADKETVYCSRVCRSRSLLHKINNSVDLPPEPMPVRLIIAGQDVTPAKKKINPHEDFSKAEEVSAEWRTSGEHWDKVARWWVERQTAAKHHSENTGERAYTARASEGQTLYLSGFGARLSVKGSSLQIVPGRIYSTQQLETILLHRAIHGVSSIVWISNGGAGLLSLEAIKWCAGQGITIRLLTNRGELLGTLFPSPDAPAALGVPGQESGRADIALRRAQYRLADNGWDVILARRIILRKLDAQQKCLDRHAELPDRERGYQAIRIATEWLSLDPPTPTTSTLDGVRLYEARAAKMYYAAWRGLRLKLDSSAERKWPAPWKEVAERASALTRWMSPRLATNPAQAALNLCYSMLESQVRQALHAVGADINCGVLHSDQEGRDSLVYDVMEGLRGEVDHLLLDFIGAHVFGAADFDTTSSGAVRIHQGLCKVLAEIVRLPQRRADDEARWFRSQLVEMSASAPNLESRFSRRVRKKE